MSNIEINNQSEDVEMNRLINKCVDSVFHKYNKLGDGRMTKAETLAFIRDSYFEQSEFKQEFTGELSEQEGQDCFEAFDINGNGVVERSELFEFIKHVCGLEQIQLQTIEADA